MENIKPKFLSNVPVGKDLFEGKSQEKTADTLCDILKREDFQVIGIDGGWGTGKSNLVSIIEKKLEKQKFHFFIYDVWGHQEDEQRRAILEELTEKICNENILSNKGKWKKKLEKLLAKEREITTINRPYLGIGIVFTLFSIIYVPTVTIFAKEIPDTFSKFGLKAFWWKAMIVGFPLVLVLMTYLWHLVEQLFFKKTKWDSFKFALQKAFQVYNNKQIDEKKIETISENEPTVKDFRNWMNEIDTDLDGKKLVLVFDNFDRLPKKNILSLWSSIHVFFAEEKYKNIKVIIPYDRQHIQNAFKDLNEKKDGNSDDAKKIKDNYSEDYINKTFDIVYRVSPPILSNWKSYFKDKWIEAFGKAENEEYERVVQLYEIFNETITPREVIVFINEIVSLKLLFNEKIPEPYFALFILNKERLLLNSLKEISEPSYLSGASYLYKNDENLPKYMTAIIYQIDPDKAVEVIYNKQLKNAMVNKDIETFKTISNSPFFSNTIYQVLNEIDNVEYPIETLDSLGSENKLSVHILKLVWEKLYDKAIENNFEEFELRAYQKVLLKNIELEKAKLWLKTILNNLYKKDTFNAEKFAKIIDELISYLKEYKIEIKIFENLIQKEVSVELFIPFISQKLEDFVHYKINCNEEELNKYLSGLDVEKLEAAKYIKYLKGDYSLGTFSKSIEIKIKENIDDRGKLDILYTRLKEVNGKPINLLLSDAQIHTLFNQSTESEGFYFDLIAMRLSRLNDYSPSYASTFATILNSEDDVMASRIAERIEFYINYEDFLIGAAHFTDSALYKLIAQKIIFNDYGDSHADIRTLLINFENICKNTGADPQLFLSDLDGWDYPNLNNNDHKILPNLLYRTSVSSNTGLAKHLIIKAIEYFDNLIKDEWINIFDNLNSKLFELLEIVSFNNWNSYSTDALLESLEKVVSEGKLLLKDKWNYVIESYERAGIPLTNVFKGVRDKFYSDRGLINKEFFTFFINHFQEKNVLDDKPGDAFRTIFKVEFLEDTELVQLMIDKADYINHLISKSQKHEVSDFVQGIKDRYENSDLIKQLAQLLKIEVS